MASPILKPRAGAAWRSPSKTSSKIAPGLLRPGPRRSTIARGEAPLSGARRPRSRPSQTPVATAVASADALEAEAGKQSALTRISPKDKILLAACLAFVISNMDKVNISIAILPMADEYGWSSSVAGLVQSSFFAGFLLMQVPGGYLATSLGGRRVLPVGLATWSTATALVPLMSAAVPTLCLSRALVGLGEAVAPSSIVDMIARTVKKEERSSAVSLAFTGLHFGSIVGLVGAPLLINSLGWRALFWVFGAAGLVWYAWFDWLLEDIARTDPDFARKLTSELRAKQPPSKSKGASNGHAQQQQQPAGALVVPYRAFLRSPAVQATMFAHFSNNWFHYTALAWVPTWLVGTLHIDLFHAASTALAPPIAGVVASVAAGQAADALVRQGMPTGTIRKLMQNIAFLGPAACLMAASFIGPGYTSVALVTAGLALSSFALAGLYCVHQDLSPKYAGALLGLTNTSGALAGILGVAAVGLLRDATDSWEAALFYPNIAVLLAGSAVFSVWASSTPVDFDAADNSPFPQEHLLDRPKAAVSWAVASTRASLASLVPLASRVRSLLPVSAPSATSTNTGAGATASGAASPASTSAPQQQAQERGPLVWRPPRAWGTGGSTGPSAAAASRTASVSGGGPGGPGSVGPGRQGSRLWSRESPWGYISACVTSMGGETHTGGSLVRLRERGPGLVAGPSREPVQSREWLNERQPMLVASFTHASMCPYLSWDDDDHPDRVSLLLSESGGLPSLGDEDVDPERTVEMEVAKAEAELASLIRSLRVQQDRKTRGLDGSRKGEPGRAPLEPGSDDDESY